jgi:FkbM family methyltransferase
VQRALVGKALDRLLKEPVRWALRAIGYELVRYNPTARVQLFREQGVTLVLDVGANTGQYGLKIRKAGYGGKILSFEPVATAFALLEQEAVRDPSWECLQIALSDEDGFATINLYGAQSSSLLKLSQSEAENLVIPDRGSQRIERKRLDSLAPTVIEASDRIFLKLDVQGSELPILHGAEETLGRVVGIEAELSLVPLYTSQALIGEVVSHLDERGFRLVWIERIMVDPRTNYLLQVDGLFRRVAESAPR